MQTKPPIVTMNPSADQLGFRQEHIPAPALPEKTNPSEVYTYTTLIAAGSVGASLDGNPAVVIVPALQRIKVTVSEVEVAPGITVGYLAPANYKFITTEIPRIADHEQLQDE